ncbi:hypothetical protein OSTOST_10248 [Ostertagia ostertagi]
MKVISEKDSPDPETLVYGMTVINKTLRGIPDSDTYYDAVDTLEMLGMEEAMKSMMKLGNNELLEQCRLYERELSKEDERAENSDDDVNARMSAIPPRPPVTNGVHFDTDEVESRNGLPKESSWRAAEKDSDPAKSSRTRVDTDCREVAESSAPSMERTSSQQAMHESDRRSVMRRRHQEARQRQEEHIAFAQSRNLFAKENIFSVFQVDYKELFDNLKRLEKECKASWDYLAKISKNDNSSMRQKINDYLTDVAQRIHQLNTIHNVTINRGKIWALEGTAEGGDPNRRRRTSQNGPNSLQRHEEMSRMLNGIPMEVRTRRHPNDPANDSPEDEILNGLVKAATLQSETRDHRRKARQFNRKSCTTPHEDVEAGRRSTGDELLRRECGLAAGNLHLPFFITF